MIPLGYDQLNFSILIVWCIDKTNHFSECEKVINWNLKRQSLRLSKATIQRDPKSFDKITTERAGWNVKYTNGSN